MQRLNCVNIVFGVCEDGSMMTAAIGQKPSDYSAMSNSSQSWYRNLCGFMPSAKNSSGSRDGLDGVRQDAKDVTEFILAEFVTHEHYRPPTEIQKPCEMLKKLIKQVMESEGEKFADLAIEINVKQLAATPNLVINTVLESMFEDGRIHWLRIVAGYVYAVEVAKRCQSEGNTELSRSVVRAVGDFIINDNIAHWIYEQGGWANLSSSFVDQTDIEQKLKSAGYLALAVGFGALVRAVSLR